MKILKQEQKEKNVAYLEFEIAQESFEEAMERAYKKNVKKINIPGFRKGHAPRKYIEKVYGEEIFYDDAINFVFPDEYSKLLEETGLDTVERPNVDIVSIEKGKPIVLSVTVTTRPEVKLGKYKGVSAKKESTTVTKTEIDKRVDALRERQARMVTVEGKSTAKKGDTVVIDYEGFVDGVAFEGGKGEKHPLELGSNSFIPGFEDALIGVKTGQEKDVNVTFPSEYHAENLAGKDAVFKCKVHEITRKELPALDDEFAKDVSEFDTLDDLKADIKKKISEEKKESAKIAFENALLDQVCDNAEVDIPKCMIEEQIDKNMEDINMRMQGQGLGLEAYLKYTNMTVDAFREQLKPEAEKMVRMTLVLDALAKAEKIEASEEDIEKEISNIAEMYHMTTDEVKKIIGEGLTSVKGDIVRKKAIDFVVDNAKTETAKKTDKDEKETAEKKPATKKTTTTTKKTTTTKSTKSTTTKKAEKKGE